MSRTSATTTGLSKSRLHSVVRHRVTASSKPKSTGPGYVKLLGSGASSTSSSTVSATLTASMVSGDNVIVAVKSQGQNVTGVTDNHGNAYTKVAQSTVSGPIASLWMCLSPTTPLASGDTVTATIAAANGNLGIVIEEYTGLKTVDQSGAANGTAATTASVSTSSQTTSSGEVAVAMLATANNSGAWSAASPFRTRDADSLLFAHGADEVGVGSGTTPSCAFSWTTSRAWGAAIATFKTS